MGSLASQEEKKERIEKTAAPVKETVQRNLSDVNGPKGGMLPDTVSARIQSMRGSGRPLSTRQLKRFSQQFDRDMSDVRIHTDSESDTISRSLNARAFTIGSDVFLTKGINPEGSGRDAQTMTHELTHVVQQNGQAGHGALRLGAADTAQEHEAEATAQRDFSPELSSYDIIQRSFFADLARKIPVIGTIAGGMMDSWDEFMSGDKKVKAAINKMDAGKRSEYNAIEKRVNDLESKELEEAKNNAEKEKGKYESEVNKQKKESKDNNDVHQVDEKGANEAEEKYNALYAEYEEKLKKQFEMVREVDESITQDDMNRYRSGKGKVGLGMILGAIGGGILGAFETDPQKKEEARKKGMRDINNFFASTNKKVSKAEFKADRKHAGFFKGDLAEETITLGDQEDKLIGAAYDDMAQEEWLKNSGMTKDEVIKKTKAAANYTQNILPKIKKKLLRGVFTDEAKELNIAYQKKAEWDEFLSENPGFDDDQRVGTDPTKTRRSLEQALKDAKNAPAPDPATVAAAQTDLDRFNRYAKYPKKIKDLYAETEHYKGGPDNIDVWIAHQEATIEASLNNAGSDLLINARKMDEFDVDLKMEIRQTVEAASRAVIQAHTTDKEQAAGRANTARDTIVGELVNVIKTEQWVTGANLYSAQSIAASHKTIEDLLTASLTNSPEMQSIWDTVKQKTKTGDLDASEKDNVKKEAKRKFKDILFKTAYGDHNYSKYDSQNGTNFNAVRDRVYEKLPADLKGDGKPYPTAQDRAFTDLFTADHPMKGDFDRINGMIDNRIPFKIDEEAKKIADRICDLGAHDEWRQSQQQNAEKAENAERKTKLIKDLWARVQADGDLKKRYKTWLLFRKDMNQDYTTFIDDMFKDGESDDDIQDAIIELLTRKVDEEKKDEGKQK